jgi:N-acyl-phosphatidylethanolamine-hydrolysing phospholipase D
MNNVSTEALSKRTLRAAIVILALAFPVFSGGRLRMAACSESDPQASAEPSHRAGRGFRNIYPDTHAQGLLAFLKMKFGMGPREAPPIPPELIPPYKPEVVPADLEAIHHPDPRRLQVTWVGQSTFLIQTDGLNILTDPLFSNRASPFGFIGPRRAAPPGVRFEDLPPIDVVVISHDHYDHLDSATIKRLGNKPRYFVPLGLGRWFAARGVSRVSELDWWQTSFIGRVLFHCVPALHWSGRSFLTFNRTLWAGWVIETPEGRVYFAGDTGYFPGFQDIGRKLGPFRLALLPIGTYFPSWYFKPMHLDPAEAVKAQVDLRARQAIGMHWGTILTSREPPAEPPLFLQKALKDAGRPPDVFVVMKFGQTLVYDW